MTERKFTRALNKPGMAAQLRETVSQVVRESAVLNKPLVVQPMDFEGFISKNKTLIQNDPHRELLIYPNDDVSEVIMTRNLRTTFKSITDRFEAPNESIVCPLQNSNVNGHNSTNVNLHNSNSRKNSILSQKSPCNRQTQLNQQAVPSNGSLSNNNLIRRGSHASTNISAITSPTSSQDSYESVLENASQSSSTSTLKSNNLAQPEEDDDLDNIGDSVDNNSYVGQRSKAECSRFTRQALHTYKSKNHLIHYKYSAYGGTIHDLPKLNSSDALREEVYEIDVDQDRIDEQMTKSQADSITKQGYLLKGPDSGSDRMFANIGNKSFKRRYCYLRQEVDGTYILELHKDEKQGEAKATIVMDFCTDVVQNPKRGRLCFELRMTTGHKSFTLAAENEDDFKDWLNKLYSVLQQNKIQEDKRVASLERTPPPCPSTALFGTLKGLEQSMNPQLIKYGRETDISIAQARRENRRRLFGNLRSSSLKAAATDNVQQYREQFGKKIFLKCRSLNFRLQCSNDVGEHVYQVEPYITSLALYDVRTGSKLTESFYFNINDDEVATLLPSTPVPTSVATTKIPKRDTHDDRMRSTSTAFNSLFENLSTDLLRCPKEHFAQLRQAIFSVNAPHADIFLVLKIEKILQGNIIQATEPYLKTNRDFRVAQKLHKTIKNYAQNIGHYRQPFAWAAKPLFKLYSSDLDTENKEFEFTTLYRQDVNKIKDDELLKLLIEYRRPDKLSKLTIVPGTLKLIIEEVEGVKGTLTKSLMPLDNCSFPLTTPTLQITEFQSNCVRDCHPYTSFCNHMFVYPISLQFDSQKIFSRARNITVVIELRDSDCENSKPLKCIYGRPGHDFLVSQIASPVLHHNTTPTWYEEVKIRLPLGIFPEHHLLFSFYHVSCNLSKKRDTTVAFEIPIGYAWLPLLQRGKIHLGEQMVPVAATLPVGYLSIQPLGLGRGQYSGPDIQWVDNQRPLFHVSVRMDSTVHTADQHLHNFFLHCERLLEDGKTSAMPAETETCKVLKAAHAIDIVALINYLPTLLNELFTLLVHTQSEEVGLNIIRLIINIIHMITEEAGRKELLATYVKYIFFAPYFCQKSNRTVHGELCRHLPTILNPSNTDFLVVNKFMHYSGIFFDLIIKSMAQHLLDTRRIRMLRNERFPVEYHDRVESLIKILIPYLISRYKSLPVETQHLNRSLSQFVRRCLTFMDRGFVFQLIRYYLGQFSPGDARILQEFKFNFLQEICQHEHYVCLNLPFLLNPKNRPPEMMQHFNLSEEFCRQHFLSGVLLQEVRSALNEIGHIRRYALSIFKNLLAKHELDDRYQNRGQLSRIALLYMPWLSIVMDNSRRIDDISQVITPNDHVYSDSTSYTHRLSCSSSSVYGKDSTLNFHTSIMNSKNHLKMHLEHGSPLRTSQHIKETDYLAAIAGAVISNGISNTSLNSLASDSQNSQNTTVGPTTYGDDPDNVEVTMRNGHNRSISVTHTQAAIRCDKFSSEESKDMLLGFLFVIKHLSHDQMIGWWQNCNETETINFMSILELCLVQFRYVGKKNLSSNDESYEVRSLRTPKASTLPARTSPPANLENGAQIQHETGTLNLNQNRDILMDDLALNKRALYESNLATEVGMIILDSLGLYSVEFRSKLHESLILLKLARVYLKFLQLGQSENLSKHVFAALRAFINNFSPALFNGNAILCGQMVYELLKACDSRLVQIRHESCAVLYLLMRSNFEFSGRKGLTRVHLQVIISVSQMIGNVIGLNNARFQESLSLINSYANSDKAMKGTGFPVEVKDLTRRVRTVLMATAQMQAHHMDPERLLELQYSLANSYAFTPELRHTWLVTMARNHEQNGNISEAACCHLHIAALMSEYLRLKGGCSIHWGSTAFSKISRNIPRDEQGLKLDAGCQDSQYTEHMLVEQLKQCAIFLTSAERYECLGDLYKLILPIYERTRMYNDLQESYEHLAKAYAKVIEVNRSGRRMLGRFYRVVFYGLSYFEEDHGIEYIYKEPKLTSLSEISQRLAAQYKEKFGADVVKLIMDSSPVDIQELDSKLAYIQVTHVIPFFSKGELDQRLNEFEQNHDVDTFMYETPFTKMGAARGSVEEQWKRKTVIKTTYSFPYVLKRIPVKSREIIELSPIEVAIDEMQTKVSELEEVILPPADIKKLQLRLQGSIAVTVNAGPLAYAQAFLDPKVVNNFSIDRVEDLKDVFRDFISVCHTALQLNARIISSDQKEYHNVLKENYQRLCQALSELLDQPYHAMEESSIMTATQRNSMALFNTISGTSTNSSTA